MNSVNDNPFNWEVPREHSWKLGLGAVVGDVAGLTSILALVNQEYAATACSFAGLMAAQVYMIAVHLGYGSPRNNLDNKSVRMVR